MWYNYYPSLNPWPLVFMVSLLLLEPQNAAAWFIVSLIRKCLKPEKLPVQRHHRRRISIRLSGHFFNNKNTLFVENNGNRTLVQTMCLSLRADRKKFFLPSLLSFLFDILIIRRILKKKCGWEKMRWRGVYFENGSRLLLEPDRTFYNFKASKPVDRLILCRSKTRIEALTLCNGLSGFSSSFAETYDTPRLIKNILASLPSFFCTCSNSRTSGVLPDRTFHCFRASKSADRRISCPWKTSMADFKRSKMMEWSDELFRRGKTGRVKCWRTCMFYFLPLLLISRTLQGLLKNWVSVSWHVEEYCVLRSLVRKVASVLNPLIISDGDYIFLFLFI